MTSGHESWRRFMLVTILFCCPLFKLADSFGEPSEKNEFKKKLILCNCPFDCLIERGIAHHKITLTEFDLSQFQDHSSKNVKRHLQQKCYSYLTGEDLKLYPDLQERRNIEKEAFYPNSNIELSAKDKFNKVLADYILPGLVICFVIVLICILNRLRRNCSKFGSFFNQHDQHVAIMSHGHLATLPSTRQVGRTLSVKNLLANPNVHQQQHQTLLGHQHSIVIQIPRLQTLETENEVQSFDVDTMSTLTDGSSSCDHQVEALKNSGRNSV